MRGKGRRSMGGFANGTVRRAARLARTAPLLLLALLVGGGLPAVLAAGYDWLQFNGDAQHSGNNTLESTLTLQNVGACSRCSRCRCPPWPTAPRSS